MSPVVCHIVGGGAFFSGAALILAAVGVSALPEKLLIRITFRVLAVAGMMLVVLSATPLPTWLYAVWFALILAWLARLVVGLPHKAERALRGLVAVSTVLIALTEVPHQACPAIRSVGHDTVFVIGDSISAGTGDKQKTWPMILRGTQELQVRNLSQTGATIRGALKQAEKLPSRACLVVLEIGGNDLLNGQPPDRFERDMRGLLRAVRYGGRTVAMFELPVPPFYNRYARIQRKLAHEFGVTLIPKRVLAGVLSGQLNTLDSIHLSDEGHRRMAETVGNLLEAPWH